MITFIAIFSSSLIFCQEIISSTILPQAVKNSNFIVLVLVFLDVMTTSTNFHQVCCGQFIEKFFRIDNNDSFRIKRD